MICINVMTKEVQQILDARRRASDWAKANKTRVIKNQARWYKANSDRVIAKSAARYAANPEVTTARTSAWRKANPEKHRRNVLEYNYGAGAYEHFKQQLDVQDNLCAICGKDFKSSKDTNLDHNHDTNQLRGALCTGCNTGLGYFKEDPNSLRKAIEYLERWMQPS